MSSASRVLILAVAGAFIATLTATEARANGDPASDLLLTQDVFSLPSAQTPEPEVDQLRALVQAAKARGFRIKVALIAGQADLGLVKTLWRKPQPYAQFLGQELLFVYRARLLIVMPNGYGIARGRKPVPGERKLLDSAAPPERTGADLATAASRAVLRLARQEGVKLTLPPLSPPAKQGENRDWIYLIVIALSIAAIVPLIFVRRPLRDEEDATEATEEGESNPGSPHSDANDG
jgi:hypothetical protein